MMMTLVGRGIRRQAIEVLVAVFIKEPGPLGFAHDQTEALIMMGAVSRPQLL